MTSTAILVTLTCCATAHLVISGAVFVYARHRTQYMALSVVNGIFAALLIIACFFCGIIASSHPGLLHPVMLLVLMAACYLQSIYPMSIPIPGYLQARRMLRYARPALIIIGMYLIFLLLGGQLVNVYTLRELFSQSLSSDMLLRLVALGLGVYYVVNIYRLPRIMSGVEDIPKYLLGYCGMLACLFVFFIFVTIFYSPVLLLIYLGLFTLSNIYLFLRVLENLAMTLPKPAIVQVSEEPEIVSATEDDDTNFNEMNLQRFRRMEYWMQNNVEAWTDRSFGRDRLCSEVGYNRHMVLQALQSQGYNNTHDYITRYRIEELKRQIISGEVTSVADTTRVGFGTVSTARSCFERLENRTLDSFIAQYNKSI